MPIDPKQIKVILLGASEYDDPSLHRLPAVWENINKLHKCFIELVGIPRRNFHLLNDQPIVRVEEKISEYTKEESELLLLYFSGHGYRDAGEGKYYLLFSDSKMNLLSRTAMDVEHLAEKVIPRNKNTILILDSCYSEAAFLEIDKPNLYIIASSSRFEESIYPLDHDLSAFTGMLIETLREGIAIEHSYLGMEDIYETARKKLERQKLPLPQSASINDVGKIQWIPNPYLRQTQKATQKEKEYLNLLFDRIKSVTPSDHLSGIRGFEREAADYDFGQLKAKVLARFPYPIAFLTARLFSGSEEILREIMFLLYEEIIQFLASILVADLCSERLITPAELREKVQATLEGPGSSTYLELIESSFSPQHRDLEWFLLECRDPDWQKEFLSQLEDLRRDLTKQDLPKEDLRGQLAQLLCSLAFLSNYSLVSVRYIFVEHHITGRPYYMHEINELYGETLTKYKSGLERLRLLKFFNSSAILFFRTPAWANLPLGDPYLNLWPMMVDARSFRSEPYDKPDFRMISGRTEENGVDQFTYKDRGNINKRVEEKYTEFHPLSEEQLREYYKYFKSGLF